MEYKAGGDTERATNRNREDDNGALYENNNDRGSFSDLLQLMSEDRPSEEGEEDTSTNVKPNSKEKRECDSRSTSKTSQRGSWEEFVTAKKWKGTSKGKELFLTKKKNKKEHVKKKEQKKRELEQDGDYFHIFLLEYFNRLCKFDRNRFRQIIMRLFNSGVSSSFNANVP